MDIEFSEAADINVEVQALNLEGIKQNLLDYVQDQAKIDIADSVDKADKSAQSAETYAEEAAVSATTASACAEQTSENLGLYYKKNETDVLLNAKADTATTLTGYGISDAYTKTEVNTALAGKASTSLDNLTADGQMIIDSQNGTISNCILEIPQNIKLTLENNVLTLKSGSILTLTGSTYATATTTHDKTISYSNFTEGNNYMIFASPIGSLQGLVNVSYVYSGGTQPINVPINSVFFNTNDRLIYIYQNNQWNLWGVCYPVCILRASGGVLSFAKDSNGNDMIFNGAGFIGHHAFIYPNVKALWSNGIDTDGTLKSGKLQNANLVIIEMATGQAYTGYNRYIGLLHNNYSNDGALKWRGYEEVDTLPDLSTSREYFRYYVKDENKIYVNAGGNWLTLADYVDSTPFIEYNYNGTSVTVFNVRQPYQGARNLLTDDLYKQIGDVETLLAAI